ncbi:hypothetical protein [Agrilutibacter solisilvae]|uniref:Uncharacterized protein n=1 Tax=Agrilutibacter solisilvae TaxID=2763317 RepID=A0A975AT11_9GAMM|nr:hypothetical protein [Lysobacter solisilvae]QSX78818.1 hypothetical protein I8J32_002505 [Lysobacter solisilvae]
MPETSLPHSPAHVAFERAPAAAQALVWAGLLACAAGVVIHGLWRELPLGRFGESSLLAGLVALLAWPLRRWREWTWAQALGAVWLLALAMLSGPVPTLAVMLLVGTGAAIGSLLVPADRPALATLVGLAVIAGTVGWLLPLPVHHLVVYALLCVALVVLRRHALRGMASASTLAWREAVDASPRAAAWAVMVGGLASAGAWLPTMQHDDLAYHAGLPWQLMLHGRYALDPTHQVWALAPWAGDVLQAIAQVMARAEARGPLNAIWLLAGLTGAWRVGRLLGGTPVACWSAVALLASLPLTAGLLGGMQTELPAVAGMLALASLALDEGLAARRRAIGGACLFALLCGLKPLHALTALPLLLWLGWRLRSALRARDLLLPAMLLPLLGASSYAWAWYIAGNPVLPLFNEIFASPYFPAAAFGDPRWHAGLGVDVLWRLSFDTSAYHEGWDGAAGLLYVALGGAWLLALVHVRTRALAACATLAIVLPLLPMQYARYLHPGLALLVPCLSVVLDRALPARAAIAVAAGLCVSQLAFQANAHWFLHTGGVKRSLAALGRDEPLFARYVPERVLAGPIRTASPDSAVLVLDAQAPYYAEFAGRGRTTDWYDPALHARAASAASGQAWAALIRDTGASAVLVRPEALTPAQAQALQLVGAQRAGEAGQAQWWRVPRAAPR